MYKLCRAAAVLFAGLLLSFGAPALTQAASGRAYVTNATANTVSILDVATGTADGTIAVGARPFDVAVNPGGSRAYVANIDAHTVSVIDTAADAVVATVPVDPQPSSIAVSPDGTRIYVVCGGGDLTVIDAATNTVIREIPGYRGFMLDAAVSPDGSRLYWTENYSNHYGAMQGHVAVADATSGMVRSRIAVLDPSAITLNAAGTRAYVVNNRGGFSEIDLSAATVTTVDKGNALFGGLGLSPDGARIYVVDRTAGTLLVLDSSTHDVRATIAVGSEPTHVAVSPDGTHVVVSNAGSGSASVVDTATNAVVRSIALGGRPGAAAVLPASALPALPVQPSEIGETAGGSQPPAPEPAASEVPNAAASAPAGDAAAVPSRRPLAGLSVPRRGLAASRAGRVTIVIRCPPAAACRGTVSLARRGSGVILGRRNFGLSRGSTRRVEVTLTPAARRALARHGRLGILLRLRGDVRPRTLAATLRGARPISVVP